MKPAPKGWCPTARRPMASGDGLLLRPHLRHGQLPADLARHLAMLAVQYGNGQLDLTQRGNLQLRGIRPEHYDAMLAALEARGIADAPAAAILTSPLAGLDSSCADGLWAMADAVELLLRDVVLPVKFLCLLDGGGVWPLHLPADLHCRPPFDAAAIAAAIQHCATQPRRRLPPAPAVAAPGYLAACHVLALAPPYGSLDTAMLNCLADLSEQYGNGQIRLAPWRLILLPGLAPDAVPAACRAAQAAGFITDAADPRRMIQACPGAPHCASGLGDTRQLAARLAPHLPQDGGITHIAGCAKGCAHGGPAARVIVAQARHSYGLGFDSAADAALPYNTLQPDQLLAMLPS